MDSSPFPSLSELLTMTDQQKKNRCFLSGSCQILNKLDLYKCKLFEASLNLQGHFLP